MRAAADLRQAMRDAAFMMLDGRGTRKIERGRSAPPQAEDFVMTTAASVTKLDPADIGEAGSRSVVMVECVK